MDNDKYEASDSNGSVNVLRKLESLMSRDEIKLSGNYDSGSEDADSSLNYDDGDVLSLQHKLSDDGDSNDKKNPDLSALIKKQMTQLQDDHLPDSKKASVVEGKTDDLSYDFSQGSAVGVKDSKAEELEAWQEVIKHELKDFDDTEEGGGSVVKGDSNMDLDMDFGLEENKLPEPQKNMAYPSVDVVDSSDVFEQEKLNDRELNEHILSAEAYGQTKEMFDQLKRKVSDSGDIKSKNSGANIEDFMMKMMKPMLKEWLDSNLPKIVKSVVQKEIKKLVD